MRGATRTRERAAMLAVAAALWAPTAAPAQSDVTLELGQTTTGNVFVEGATPSFDVETSAEALAWSVSDLSGREVGTGRALVAGGRGRVELPITTAGYYELHVSAAGASAQTTFALVPAAERAGEGGFTFSVQTHFGQGWDPPTLVPLLAAIGAESVRDAQRWEDIESAEGEYDFSAQDGRYQRYMDALTAAGIEPLINFGRANRFHDRGCTPYTDAGRRALARFVGEVLRHEWLPWLERYLSRGGARRLDAVSLHPYRPGHTPEGLAKQQIGPVRELMDASPAAEKPIWITELGWRSEAVGERDQAAYLPRAYVLAMQAGVQRVSWYNLADHGKGTFGLLHGADRGHTPKPAFVAYAVMTAQLGALSYAAADRTPAGIHSHRFAGGEQPVRVMWAVNDERVVRLRTDEPVEVTDTMGTTRTLAPEEGLVTLTLSGDPSYVRGDIESITREG